MAPNQTNLKPAFAILGSDTDIGKTYVTKLLIKSIKDQGIRIESQKWLQCGSPYDLDAHGYESTLPPSLRMPYCFELPASPHLAAKHAGVDIDEAHISSSFYEARKACDWLVIEGSGGLMVPLSDTRLFIDLIAGLKIPVILVVPQRIGCINQSLSHLEVLKTRNIDVLGVIINEHTPTELSDTIKNDHKACIEDFGKTCVLASLEYGQKILDCTMLFEQLEKAPSLC